MRAQRWSRALWRVRWVIGAAAAAELALAACVATFATRASPVGVDEAVARFRARVAPAGEAVPGGAPPPTLAPPRAAAGSTTTPGPAPRAVAGTGPAATTSQPPPQHTADPGPLAEGVYVYDTTGYEELDVGGARHDYPAQTTITVTRVGCGLRLRWQPLRERWDERDVCPSPEGERLVAFRSHHEFFGRTDDRDFACEPGALARPARPTPGTTWSNRCRAGETLATTTGRIVGPEVVDVGGEKVEVVHFVLESRIEGDGTGTARSEVWAVWETGLVVRQSTTVDSAQRAPVGTVGYRERFELRLQSLTPRR